MQTVLDLRPCAAHHARLARQASLILAHLQAHGSITPREGLELYGCQRVAARIVDLKRAGYLIRSQLICLPDGVRYAYYTLEGHVE